MSKAQAIVDALRHYAPQDEALALAQRRAALPVSEGGLGLLSDNTPMDRARAMGYTTPAYHGTTRSFTSFDSSRSGLGTHLGTQEQALNRLKDLNRTGDTLRALVNEYETGAQTLPVLFRPGTMIDMPDVGMWNNADQVLDALPKGHRRSDLHPYAGKNLRETKANNRAALNELRNSARFDTVRYKNEVENQYGNLAGLTKEAEAERDRLLGELKRFDELAFNRRPPIPDLNNPDGDRLLQEWLDAPSSTEHYLTPEELSVRQDVLARYMKAGEQQADPSSYVVLHPENIRSRFAAFDPFRRNESDLLASVAPYAAPAAAGAAGLAATLAPSESEAGLAGKLARTADWDMLRIAQDAERSGLSPERIYDATGWARGADKEWRFEFDDSQAKLKDAAYEYQDRQGVPQERLFEHPSLYTNYNDSAGMIARVDPLSSAREGAYTPGKREIRAQARTDDELKSVLLHENQHGIQEQEGFATGGGHRQFVREMVDEGKKIIDRIGEIDASPSPSPDLLVERQALIRELQDKQLDDNALIQSNAYDKYRALAGEVEARNVQSRMDMTPDDRRMRPFWQTEDTPRDQQIVKKANRHTMALRRYGEARATPRNPIMGFISDALRKGKDIGNTVQVPWLGGVGDIVAGEAPEFLDDMSYGGSPLRGSGMATTVDPRALDAVGLIPSVSPILKALRAMP